MHAFYTRRLFALFCAALLMSATLTFARADRSDDAKIQSVRADLTAIYATFATSVKKGDAEAVLAYEADDYTQTSRDGKVKNKREADAEFRRGLAQLKTLQVTDVAATIDTLQYDAATSTATLTVTQTLTASAKDKDGTKHEIVSIARSRDAWRWHANLKAYRLHASQELEISLSIDGRKLP